MMTDKAEQAEFERDMGSFVDQYELMVAEKLLKGERSVSWGANDYGYAVKVFQGEEVVYEYSAGNNVLDSEARISPDSPRAVAPEQLKKWAIEAAEEIAGRYDVSMENVYQDHDYEDEHTT